MATGLILAAAMKRLTSGSRQAVRAFGIFWRLNGWFRMGFPPCARLMTHWLPRLGNWPPQRSVW
jgi:OPA family glycerol-3-phosphate transporter-like MFS transporter/OPA family sugar phosphate sensor protein UhpC-like MFS transporter